MNSLLRNYYLSNYYMMFHDKNIRNGNYYISLKLIHRILLIIYLYFKLHERFQWQVNITYSKQMHSAPKNITIHRCNL